MKNLSSTAHSCYGRPVLERSRLCANANFTKRLLNFVIELIAEHKHLLIDAAKHMVLYKIKSKRHTKKACG